MLRYVSVRGVTVQVSEQKISVWAFKLSMHVYRTNAAIACAELICVRAELRFHVL